MINLQRMECFIKVYEELNITKASQQLFVTQQALSRTIKSLEDELGVTLFFRHSNGLRIGISNGVFPAMNVDIPIAAFRKKYPDIQLSILSEADVFCESLLQSGEIDCAFLVGKTENPQFNSTLLYQEPVYVWIHKTHPLAKKEYITLSDLIDEPLIMINDQYKYNIIFKNWCYTRGLEPNIRYLLHDPMTIYYLASKNEGIALHPRYWQTMLVPNDELVDLPLIDKHFSSWQISLCNFNRPVPSKNEMLFTEFILKYYIEHPF